MTQNKKETEIPMQEQVAENETVGALLRRTRLAKKQDLRDIASYLCIRYQFLEALEEGRYKELPGEAYANGFIRSYASYLGLNAADIITQYKREFFEQTKKENASYAMSAEEAENIVPAPKVLVVSVVLLLVAFCWWQSSSKKEEDLLPVVEEQVDSITVVDQSYPLAEEDANVEKTTEAENVPEAEKVTGVSSVPPVPPVKPEYTETSKAPEKQTVKEPPEAQKERTEEPKIYGQKNKNHRLVLRAKEETWVEITRGETLMFSRLLNEGDQYWVSADNPEELKMKTGNAGGLEIYCDGMLTQALGPRGTLRSNISLIPDDFAAKIVEVTE